MYGAADNIPAGLHYCDHFVTGALIERICDLFLVGRDRLDHKADPLNFGC
jgi:hypothetical protein